MRILHVHQTMIGFQLTVILSWIGARVVLTTIYYFVIITPDMGVSHLHSITAANIQPIDPKLGQRHDTVVVYQHFLPSMWLHIQINLQN